jgi:hypothetical protein
MIDQDIKRFILTYLVARNGEVVSGLELRGAIRGVFARVALTDGDLKNYTRQCEMSGWISGTTDELLGDMWALTPKGTIKANQL